MEVKIINEQEVFAINPSLTVQTKNIGKYKIAIADNFYKNPEHQHLLIHHNVKNASKNKFCLVNFLDE